MQISQHSQDAFNNALHDGDTKSEEIVEESSPIPKPTEITENITIPLVQEILAAAKPQENRLDKLPEVPASDDAFDDDPISEEKEIEARLLRLKRFRKTWCSEQPRGETEPFNMTSAVVTKPSVPKGKSEVIGVSLSDSKEDAEGFIKWYLNKIDATYHPPSEAVDFEANPTAPKFQVQAEVETVSPEQEKNADKKSSFTLGRTFDEKMDHAMPNPYTNNMVEGSSVIYSITMENVVVLFLAIYR